MALSVPSSALTESLIWLDIRAAAVRDLLEHVDAKMQVNRARKWRLDGNGHGQHVEEGDIEVHLALKSAGLT
jgi:hypothetical protein